MYEVERKGILKRRKETAAYNRHFFKNELALLGDSRTN